ncbi:polyhydroxyalkanoic acid system family protein [Psychrobacter raelei]|uniref:Polyhydroxyalkanoic acid system family protein n=1 Tax=Psychrobacter raelei TaxID=2565531 RepID=A0AAT9PGG7_9GAMM
MLCQLRFDGAGLDAVSCDDCLYLRLEDKDIVTFKRTGATGQLLSAPDKFELDAKLGFLFKSFLPKIKQQIEQNLDKAIAEKS